MEEELPIKEVTCHTPGCLNEGVTITLPCADLIFCGACGQPIADVELIASENGS